MLTESKTGIIGWANTGLTLAAIKLGFTIPEAFTLLFVTIPVGVWSWLRLIDYVKARKTNAKSKENDPAADAGA